MTKRMAPLLALLWILFLAYLGVQDADAFEVSLVLTLPFSILLYYAWKSRNVLLSIFTGLGFIAHVIGAPFFFLSRENYSFSGFGAVRNFDFETAPFLRMYPVVLLCFAAILAFTVLLDRMLPFPYRRFSRPKDTSKHSQVARPAPSPSRKAARAYDLRLAMFVFLIAVPVNWFMYTNRIGILGVESVILPYRLTGLLYYCRLFVFPLILFLLYTRSSRSAPIAAIVLAYALFSGLSSASRTVYILSFLPVPFALLSEKRYFRFALILAVSLVGFFLVSSSRDSSYQDYAVTYDEMILAAVGALFDEERVSVIAIVGQIANRLYGAQDIVLAFQYEPAEPWLVLVRYFLSGGAATAVVPDLTYELFGLVFEEGTAFGVGLGIVSYLVMLGHTSVGRLLVGSLVVALLLSIGNRLMTSASHRVFGNEPPLVFYFAALVVAFSLYSSQINFYVYQIGFLVIAALAIQFSRRIRWRLPHAHSGARPAL